jgi:hypothetical protein
LRIFALIAGILCICIGASFAYIAAILYVDPSANPSIRLIGSVVFALPALAILIAGVGFLLSCKRPANKAMKRPLQFSLRQLLIVVTVFSVLLGLGRWYYLHYVYAIPLTAEDDLADYVGKRVRITGRYSYCSDGFPKHIVHFGNGSIGCYELNGDKPLPPDEVISVTGLLRVTVYYLSDRPEGDLRMHYLDNATFHY